MALYYSRLEHGNGLLDIEITRSQEWKKGSSSTLGSVRQYEPNPPPQAPDSLADPSKFPLRLVKLEVDMNPALKGWNRFKISLPPAIRSRHLSDPVYGPDWASLLKDFDSKLLGHKPRTFKKFRALFHFSSTPKGSPHSRN